jgi:hypothetical protein
MKNIIINVAIVKDFYFFTWSYEKYINILNNYDWEVNDKKFEIRVKELGWNEIIKELKNEKFDVIIVPNGDTFLLYFKSIIFPFSTKKWKKQIREFIKNGGGAIAHCAGTILFCKLNKSSNSISEFLINKKRNKVPVSEVSLLWDVAIPPYNQLINAGNVGESAYVYYSGMNVSDQKLMLGGFPLKMNIQKSHPIFRGFEGEKCSVRWVGGPALIPKGGADIIMSYPSDEEFNDYKIHRWLFNNWGELFGEFIKTSVDFLKNPKKDFADGLLKLAQKGWKTSGWIKSKELISVELADYPAMTAEKYGKGRIILCASHPELPIWDTQKGRFKEVKDDGDKTLWNPVIYWENIDEEDLNPSTEWIVRREVAWASNKVLDYEMPPIKEEICEVL